MSFTITPLALHGMALVQSSLIEDHRGAFYRAFCDHELATFLHEKTIRQINISRTEAIGSIRGLHFQYPPMAEVKLIRCLQGQVWDVAVDLRKNSPTFLQWTSVELKGTNRLMVVIPEGCAHGFQVLEPRSELLYLHTAPYMPKLEGGIHYNDPQLNITWPLPVSDVSQKDQSHLFLPEDFEGIVL
jgi:dTDP-4-dehydrorhamnose 3,5-epimerase